MVALRTSVFVSESKEVQPNKREFVLHKNRLTLTFCDQCYLECSGGTASYHEIQDSGEEHERSIQYSNHNYKVDLNNFGNRT